MAMVGMLNNLLFMWIFELVLSCTLSYHKRICSSFRHQDFMKTIDERDTEISKLK